MPEPMRLQIMKAISAKIAEAPGLEGNVVRGVTPVGYSDTLPVASIFEDYNAMMQARLAPSQPHGAREKIVRLPLSVVGMLRQANDRTEDYDRCVTLMYEIIEKLNEGRSFRNAQGQLDPFGAGSIRAVEIGTGSAQGPSPIDSVEWPHCVIPIVISYVEM